MDRKAVSGMMLTLLLIGILTLAFDIQPVKASGTIFIRADGSVEGTTHITSVDNVTYTFTDNIYDEIVVERDNIVVDGAGYTVQGTGSGAGIALIYRNNVTLKNVEVTNFNIGIGLSSSSNNTLAGNTASSNNDEGISLDYSSNNNLTGNTASNNRNGIALYSSSNNNTLFHNNLIDNTFQADVTAGYVNTWDDGYPSGGNYWSDYTGSDADGDGIGDTPYIIDTNNRDRYPLMSPWGEIPEEVVPFWMLWWFWAIVVVVIVALAGAVYFLKKRKPPTPTAPTPPSKSTLQKTTQNTNPLTAIFLPFIVNNLRLVFLPKFYQFGFGIWSKYAAVENPLLLRGTVVVVF